MLGFDRHAIILIFMERPFGRFNIIVNMEVFIKMNETFDFSLTTNKSTYLKSRSSLRLCTTHNKITLFEIVPTQDWKTALLQNKYGKTCD